MIKSVQLRRKHAKNDVPEKQWDLSDIPDLPFMEKEGIYILGEELSQSRVFLEYGSGGSTVMATKLPGLAVHSVDSDRGFLDAVSKRCLMVKPDCNLTTHYVDIGKTAEWGVPIERELATNWPHYCSKPWIELHKRESSPDLVLIDGRFRVSCFLISLALSSVGTVILFDDYANREQYHVIEKAHFTAIDSRKNCAL